MSDGRADRNLLFGILAVQLDFVDRDALIAAMHAWVLAKQRPLGEILVEQGALSHDDREALETIVDRHLHVHDNDVERSLAAQGAPDSLHQSLRQIADPDLHASLAQQNRYNAACAAALAGCGQGEDAASLDVQERTRLRQQSLAWLRADLTAWNQLLEKQGDKARPTVLKTMQHWQQDTDFAGVRGEALAELPEAERQEWRKLWEDVEALRQRAAGSK